MQYNVENLFDTSHDEGTEDWTYLPLAKKNADPTIQKECKKASSVYYIDLCLTLDWNEERLLKKIQNIAKVIKSYDETEKGPDIIVIQEVENLAVLKKLVDVGLKDLGYESVVLIEGRDPRGIDVGIISKFPVISSQLHSLFEKGKASNTRGILEVAFDVDGEKLVVLGNHWPSQRSRSKKRIVAAKLLHKLANNHRDAVVVAAGDFNVLDSEKPHPFKYLKSLVEVKRDQTNSDVGGTLVYNGRWLTFDRIFIKKKDQDKVKDKSYRILAHPFMLKKDEKFNTLAPYRYEPILNDGYSDHLPVIIQLEI